MNLLMIRLYNLTSPLPFFCQVHLFVFSITIRIKFTFPKIFWSRKGDISSRILVYTFVFGSTNHRNEESVLLFAQSQE